MIKPLSGKRSIPIIIACFLAIDAAVAHAGSGEWTFLGGASEENSRGFAVAGNPTTLYLATQAYNGYGKSLIYRSKDLGVTWSAFPLPENGLDGKNAQLITGEGNPPALYYVNVNSIDNVAYKYRSDDEGETWTSTQETIVGSTDSGQLAVSPGDSNVEWKLDTSTSGLMLPYLSSDAGKTWSLIMKSGHFAIHNADTETARLVFDPNNAKRIFLYHDARNATGYPSEVWEFTIPDATTTTEPQKTVKGDVNGDGKVTIADATIVLRIAVGLIPQTSSFRKASPVKKASADLKRRKISSRLRGIR